MNVSRLLFLVLIAVAIVWPVRTFVVDPIYIASASMEPTLKVGDHLFLDRVTFRFRPPRRGEIIAFQSPVGENHDSVKRVIAVSGDTVEIKSKKIWLNGQEQSELYVRHSRADEILEGDTLAPMTVPQDSFFVLGDNRDESKDSASWKDPQSGKPVHFIGISSVKGKIRGIY